MACAGQCGNDGFVHADPGTLEEAAGRRGLEPGGVVGRLRLRLWLGAEVRVEVDLHRGTTFG